MCCIQFCLAAVVASAISGISQATCSPCPFQWMENGNYCYRYFPQNLSYDEAEMFCKQFSHTGHVAELATVSTLGELNFIMTYIDAVLKSPLSTFGHYIWLKNTISDAGKNCSFLKLILHKQLGGFANEKPCSAVAPNTTEYEIIGNHSLVKMVPSPDVADHACAVYAQSGSYLDLGDFKDTCVSDPGLCESMTWSLWLKIDTSSGFTASRYYISSGGQTSLARGIAFLYKRTSREFVISLRTEQAGILKKIPKPKIPLNDWFHLVITIDRITSNDTELMLYINSVPVSGDETINSGIPQDGCTKLFLGMSNTCGSRDISTLSGSAAYSDLAVYNGSLTQEQITGIHTCSSPDWALTLSSLVMKSDVEYECTASNLPGPTITWSLYHKQTDSWENLDTSGDGYTILSVNVSTCVSQSTLVIGQSPLTGDIVGCTAHTGALNTSAYLFFGDGVTVGFRDNNAAGFAIWADSSSIVYTGHRSNHTSGHCGADYSDQCALDQEIYPMICKIER
ncbi:uncharacterized protein [Asterias amurensis]|uniref:uncharacterized protein n=1 Tax=Asterias amurensis TaxID=7602 RepID=UPI003AB52E6D